MRAWTFRREDGQYSAAFTINEGRPYWAPRHLAKETEAKAAAWVEHVVGKALVSSEFIHAAVDLKL